MRIEAIAFTRRGVHVASCLGVALRAQGDEFVLSCPARYRIGEEYRELRGLDAWCKEMFACSDALLFVCACGIATRGIAPYVTDKFDDPAVVCVDEGCSFAVPLLSGHVGGANALARRIAALCGASPVITTATDVNGVFAVDEWATFQGLALLDRDEAKQVSAALLRGERVGFASDFEVRGPLPAGVLDGEAGASCARGFSVSIDAGCRPFGQTLRMVPRAVVVGVGCKRGTRLEDLRAWVDERLSQSGVAQEAVRALATIDVKADEPCIVELAHERGWELRLYRAEELARVPGEFSASAFVGQVVGVDNVCERAACAGGGKLVDKKHAKNGVTVALAVENPELSFAAQEGQSSPFVVTCVGIGPGGGDDMTLRAHKALLDAEVIVGYTTYVDLVRSTYPHAEFVATGMRGEVQRCREALRLARAGRRVAVVCSGDPGVYGMAGLLMELAGESSNVRVEVVPGVSAANGGAALLGAPLMNDWCCVSLSDLMTPWGEIEERLRAAAQAGFCICLYNPGSRGREGHLRQACDVLLEQLDGETACGIVRNVGRRGEACNITTLVELRDAHVDMCSCVFVGNARTRVIGGRLVTPRGYALT